MVVRAPAHVVPPCALVWGPSGLDYPFLNVFWPLSLVRCQPPRRFFPGRLSDRRLLPPSDDGQRNPVAVVPEDRCQDPAADSKLWPDCGPALERATADFLPPPTAREGLKTRRWRRSNPPRTRHLTTTQVEEVLRVLSTSPPAFRSG